MAFPLSAKIAWRYLCAKKSHSAVTAISIVSICGIAVATAAIICVLSVFNGFKSVIADRLDTLSPDVMVTPAQGKVFTDADSLCNRLRSLPEIEIATPTILENALTIYEGHETPVAMKGVRMADYRKMTTIDSLILDTYSVPDELKELTLQADEEGKSTLLSVGIASRIGAYPGSNILLFAPRREGRVNLANPAASFLTDSFFVTGIYRANQSEYDENRIIVDLDLAREMLQYDTEASAIEIKAKTGVNSETLAAKVSKTLGNSAIVKDRLHQQEMNFRMISIEKWVTFLLLFFILIIASFNIISSLSMLVLEKQKSMFTLTALGMPRQSVGNVFRWESIFVTLIGGIAGIVIGISLCLLQEKYGFIKLQGEPGALIIQAYPVVVKLTDILVTILPIAVVGACSAWITGAFAKSRI